MHSVTGILGDELVRAHRREMDRVRIDHERQLIARVQSERLVAKSRRLAGALIVSVGKVVQGRQFVEPRIDRDPIGEAHLNLAR